VRDAVAAFPRSARGNRYCDLLYGALAARGVRVVAGEGFGSRWLWRARRRVAVVHLHWPETAYRGRGRRVTPRSAVAFAASLLAARLLGYRLVWTVHNALPHERQRLDHALHWLLFRLAQPVVHAAAARAMLPGAGRTAVVVPHGHYVGAYPDDLSDTEARRRLGLGPRDLVFVCFGQVRAYKGVRELISAFQRVAAPHWRLVIAGQPGTPADGRAVLDAAGADRRIHTVLRFVPDDQVQIFMRAADWVVLPYRAVLTSGAALLAASFARAVIAPRLGCLVELADAGVVLAYRPEDPDGLEHMLAEAARTDARALGARARRIAEGFDWNDIAAAYARVFGLPAPSHPHRPRSPERHEER